MYQLRTKRRCREKSVITVEKSGASSIVDASRRASSRIDVGLLPHLAPGPDAEVTTDFRQWNIVSRRGKISMKRRSSRMQAIDMRLMTRTSSTFRRPIKRRVRGAGCGREGQA
ncbi:BZ3500_MvSof-1268-A1-R1_Chr1-2g01479 [Microbotryum saponariae]|uniref:BZ3500_MvSof-1268-A1-R1_Chr1-2g01479 protein n=1 Tax=Microbotryum saponariae TaxID=289078 RepID=A0A2X0KWG6_9BASI|nr:BZ3500_MvSof-1268-A1-R1_Chr1-2g01479 [Microbotryum saponariae]SCZ97487.1 BZ3501_MvSof-1269-A2-R1_Chr1-2g01078 [Microbotryum saponariae]